MIARAWDQLLNVLSVVCRRVRDLPGSGSFLGNKTETLAFCVVRQAGKMGRAVGAHTTLHFDLSFSQPSL